MLTAADVNALYPSIQLERGMTALRWFMDNHTSFNQTLKDLCLKLAHFVLTNNYVVCKELGCTIYRQRVGTAMGTSFSGIFAVIFVIRLESPIVNDVRFRRYIRLYKRFIDDLFLIWTGPATVLCDFRHALATADEAISLEWSGYESYQDAVNPSLVAAKRHEQVNYLDLDMSLQRVRIGEALLSERYSGPTASRATLMPTFPSPPSMDAIPSGDGCWRSFSGS